MSRQAFKDELESSREFKNSFHDYHQEKLLGSDGKLISDTRKCIKTGIERLVGRLEAEYNQNTDPKDYSIYTGTAGVGMMYWLMSQCISDENEKAEGATSTHYNEAYLSKAKIYVDSAIKNLSSKKSGRVAFLGGEAGPLALGAVVYLAVGQNDASKDCLNRLISMSDAVLSDSSLPDEVLFGRAGYLLALLYVRSELGDSVIDKSIINKIVQYLLDSGQSMARRELAEAGLMYEWHERKYLGAAHGLAGILYVLMQAVNVVQYSSEQLSVIMKSVDYLLSLQFPSGNFPSSIGSSSGDKLVHWCHGAPGWVYMFLSAYQLFKRERHLDAAKTCAEVVWSRGLLRKGYGICHGVAGNAYCLLALYNTTGDQRYLYRAIKFAEWCLEYGKHGCRIPDRPYSLFEGMAGTIYFLVDIVKPGEAKFPAFQM